MGGGGGEVIARNPCEQVWKWYLFIPCLTHKESGWHEMAVLTILSHSTCRMTDYEFQDVFVV